MAYAIHGVELGKMITPLNDDGTPAGEAYDDGTGSGSSGGSGGGSFITQIASDITKGVLNTGAGFLNNFNRPPPVVQPKPSAFSSYAIPVAILAGVGVLAVVKMKKKA